MKVSDVIAISSSSGTVKAGLESFKRFFERLPSFKEPLEVTEYDIETINSAINIMSKIYNNARKQKLEE